MMHFPGTLSVQKISKTGGGGYSQDQTCLFLFPGFWFPPSSEKGGGGAVRTEMILVGAANLGGGTLFWSRLHVKATDSDNLISD